MNETVLTWIIFILAFGGMVIVHEFGHFIAARLVKVEVEEFGIGFPTPGAITFWIGKGHLFLQDGRRIEIPQNFNLPIPWNSLVDRDAKLTVDEVNERFLLRSIEADTVEEDRQGTSLKHIQAGNKTGALEIAGRIAQAHPGTRFTFNWLPLGGFVRPKGENDPNVEGGLAAAAPWKRLFVLSAGPIMNLVTAVLVISVIIGQMGGIIVSPPADYTGPREILITEVVPNSPAEQAGVMMGDVLLEGAGQPLNGAGDLEAVVTANVNKPTVFVVLRDGKKIELTITPLINEQAGRPMVGVGYCGGCKFQPITSVAENLKYSVQFTGAQIYGLITLPVRLIQGVIPPEQGRLVGLKGIFDIMSQSVSNDVEATQSQPSSAQPNPYTAPVQTLSIIAILSISLGVLNLFPFPALDGGRILFVLPELIFRRRVPHQFENLVHGLGMTLLIALMIYINVRDFIDPVTTAFP
ncbi:site-2 protease family protein [Chloroflexi bacterium CFX6]|nr:site-2 protease family protein [Chloroflexi bacterium CFX6]